MLFVINSCENVSEEKEENIEEANKDFISMKGNFSSLKFLRGRCCARNGFK